MLLLLILQCINVYVLDINFCKIYRSFPDAAQNKLNLTINTHENKLFCEIAIIGYAHKTTLPRCAIQYIKLEVC